MFQKSEPETAKPQTVEGSILPRSTMLAKKLLVASVERLSSQEKTAFAVMQGLVNRSQPQVFLIYDLDDAHWLEWLRKRGDIATIEWVGPYEIFRRFRSQMKGCVVTDPSLPGTVNVATLLGGIKSWLVVSPELVDTFGLPIKEDLRGRWKRDVDAYRWAYSQLYPSAAKSVLCHLDPGVSQLRDYLAEFKVFTFWLSGTEEEEDEEEFARELFECVGPNVPILGWWGSHGHGTQPGIGEGAGVDLASEYGLFTVCSAWDGHCESTGNLSVHSGTRATFQQKPAPPMPKLENKVYYTFVRTDGDGTNFWRQEFLHRWWDAQHGETPVNWTIGPLAFDLMPDIMDYFYKNASSNDYFMAAVSGIGYIHEDIYGKKLPTEVRRGSFNQFLRLTAEYMKRMDLHFLQTYRTSSAELVEKYTQIEGLKALFLNYYRGENTTVENAAEMINGVPVFRAVMGWPSGENWEEKANSAAAQLREFVSPRLPAFLNFSLTNWGGTEMETMGVLQKVQKNLPSEYCAVRADHFVDMYKSCRARNGGERK